MKYFSLLLLLATLSFTLTNCNKKDQPSEYSVSKLPAYLQKYLQPCEEGCKRFVQLVNLDGHNYYYLGITAILCDPGPNRILYTDMEGSPVPVSSNLHHQIASRGVLLEDIWNCE